MKLVTSLRVLRSFSVVTIERSVLEGLRALRRAAVSVTIAKWKTIRNRKSIHEVLGVGEKALGYDGLITNGARRQTGRERDGRYSN